MLVNDLMTPDPVTIDPGADLATALGTMDHFSVRHLPVVEDEMLVGLVSDRDLLGLTGWRVGGRESDGVRRRIREVMNPDPVCVAADDQVVSAAVEVSCRGIGCLPVVEGGHLVGIVSEVDLMRFVAEYSKSNVKIEDVAVRDIAAAGLDANLGLVDILMNARGIRHVPVIEDGQLVGLVSDRDMRRAVGAGLGVGAGVQEFMTPEVLTVPHTLLLREAAGIMADRRISALVVSCEEENGRQCWGIVTSTDILEHAAQVVGDLEPAN